MTPPTYEEAVACTTPDGPKVDHEAEKKTDREATQQPEGQHLRVELQSIIDSSRAKAQYLRPTNLSPNATRLADILTYIISDSYQQSGISSPLTLRWQNSRVLRSWGLLTICKSVNESRDEFERSNPTSPHCSAHGFFSQGHRRFTEDGTRTECPVLIENVHIPSSILGIPIHTTEALLLQMYYVFYRTRCFIVRQSDYLELQEKRGEWDELAKRLCTDMFVMVPAVAKTKEHASTIVLMILVYTIERFPEGHCWREFTSQMYEFGRGYLTEEELGFIDAL